MIETPEDVADDDDAHIQVHEEYERNRLWAGLKVARKLAESVADWHGSDYERGVWDTAQRVLAAVGEPLVVCKAKDCVKVYGPCPGWPGWKDDFPRGESHVDEPQKPAP